MSELQRYEINDFQRLLHLARILGPESFEEVYESVIDNDDEYGYVETTVVGAPDLLLWTTSLLPPFWFFAEVKGRNDHIRGSQVEWIRTNWQNIKGRVMIISVL